MNGALIEQGILNIEIEPETALKVFGKRDKSKREKKESPLQNSPQNMTRKIKCFPKIEKKEEKQEEEPKENWSKQIHEGNGTCRPDIIYC